MAASSSSALPARSTWVGGAMVTHPSLQTWIGLDAALIEEKLVARKEARTNKDWATSDQIRDELDAQGILIMDTADGVEWRVKLS